MRMRAFGMFLLWLTSMAAGLSAELEVASSKRYLTLNGKPFFWLGDTVWLLAQLPSRDELELYLRTRLEQGFTVIQLTAVMGEERVWGTTRATSRGDVPFVDHDVSRPVTAYWNHLDHVLERIHAHGLHAALVTFFVGSQGDGYKFLTKDKAHQYGRFLGERYRGNPDIIWVLGGDHVPKSDDHKAVWNLVAKGIAEGLTGKEDYSRVLMTYHISGGSSSSQFWHDSPWLDFNMSQTWSDYQNIYSTVLRDYQKTPVKPCGLGEGAYEDGPQYPTKPIDGLVIRKQACWSWFAGGYHTYGNGNVWHFDSLKAEFTQPWKEALHSRGAATLRNAKKFLESIQWWNYVPDQSLITEGKGVKLNVAMRTSQTNAIAVYLANPVPITLRLDKIPAGAKVNARCVNPSTGEEVSGENFDRRSTTLTPPARWDDALLHLTTSMLLPSTSPEAVQMDPAKLAQARDYALTGEGSGLIVRHGKIVLSWGDLKARYDLKSTTKSFGAAAFGLALLDGKLRLEDRAAKFHPALGVPPETNRATGWLDEITMLHLLTQTAGFEKPGGYTRLLFKPGTKWDYSDSGPNWLAECITLAYRQDLDALMFDRIFTPIGIGRDDLVWRKNQYRPDLIEGIKRREFGAGISANVDAMAKFGYLHLRKGDWNGDRLLPADYIELVSKPHPSVVGLPVLNTKDYSNASDHYGLLWWNNADGTLVDVPRDAYWSWGLYDSLIVVIPSLDIVVARAGKSWKREPNSHHYDVLKPFLGPICASVQRLTWAPRESIIRKARGGDNWPMTWGDDDALYTAYGDGRGFEPFIPEKLSLGFAKVHGSACDFTGENIRAPTVEQKGEGERGRKAGGILMVDGILYLLVRNATNSQIAWSSNRGQTWAWCDWKFTESFGCPTFLNFGRNYSGARDSFVYIFSPDSDSAYTAADRMVLARVPADRIRERDAYEFFMRLDRDRAIWSKKISERGAVFENPGKCYRSGVTYHAASKRYLWCQILPGKDTRFAGGFAVCDAPEPWGPWTTTFHTENWDVGPGETCSFPTKWMEPNGTNLYLVFSGDDCFSVRRATLNFTR